MSPKEKKELLNRKQKLEARLNEIEESGLLDSSKYDLMPCEISNILDELKAISLKINNSSN